MQKEKIKLTQKDAENSPAGGVVVGKRNGQTMIYDDASVGGYFVGKTHDEGGIKMVNKSNGQPLEVQGSEVIITAPAVADQTKRNFDGKMMTNREILSTINERGGGVAFAEKGMEIPKKIKRTGASYNYGGKTMTDHEIYKYITGGGIAEDFSIRDIANIHQVPLSELKEEVRIGMIAESEHKADKKEQMEIVKDHLLENPKYYTVLKKAGLVDGGEIYLKIDERDKKIRNDKDYYPYEILNNKGEKLGKIDLMYRSDLGGYQISNSNVIEKGKGIGKKAYLELRKLLGKPIYSDSLRSEDAENMWKSLEKSNYAKYNNNLGKYEILKHGGRVHKNTLVRDAKSGNTPARDLNNYNDVLDIDADGMVGAETGLYAYGGRVSNSKLFMPSVRGGWTKEKIIRYQKSHSSDTTSTLTLLKYISEFADWQEFKNHIYYHGTQSYIEKGLKPSITMSEREVERIGGGGYGQRYFGISLTKRKRTAESFSGMSNSVTIYPVILKRDSKVIERTDLQDASEIEDIIVELYDKGVDAVYIGGGEEELVVVNPFSILLYKKGREYHSVFGGFKSVPLTDEKIKEIYNNSKILSDKYIEEYNSKQNKEERNQFTNSIPNIQFEKGGLIAPNGKPSGLYFTEIYNLVRTPEFKAWFGDWEEAYITKNYDGVSKIIDENGEPLICVHNSPNEFFEFDEYKMGSTTDAGYYGKGFYFFPNVGFDKYGKIEYNCFLNIKNPYFKQSSHRNYELKSEELKNEGFDGVIVYPNFYKDFNFENGVDNAEEIVAYYSEQIKLADGTNTTFDANNPDIRFDDGGAVGKETVLFAVRKGEPDYNEVLITNNPDRIEDAKKWALANGFDRLRVSTIDMREKPDFRKTFEGGGYMENGGYLDSLSEKSKKTIDSNYMQQFGFYDFNWNKESQRENFDEWFTKFNKEQFKKNLNKVISLISEDIDLLEKRKQSDKKLKDFEELILPTLGNDVKYPSLSEYQEMVLMNPYVTEEELREALSDTSIFDKEGSIDKAKITQSEFFSEDGINLPRFEQFVEKNPEYKGVFDNWKKMLDENYQLSIKETNAFRYPSLDDLKELKEELSTLDKTNYASGGNIIQYDTNMEVDSADMMFADGGAVGSVVKNWNEVPSIWKDTSKVKKVAWTNSPYDKGLYSIVAPFLGKDELRPIFGGINFDENGITVTNTYTLITLPYPSKKFEGTYEADLSKKPNPEQITIDGKYPNYSAIIPKQEVTKPFFIDVYKLLQYNNVAMKFANKYTNAVNYKIEDEIVGFNAKFLNENLKTLLKLGHETAYAHYMSNKNALLLSPNKDYEIGNDEIILTMPVMIQNKSYGAVDVDSKRELSVYYDFNDNEIHNADGSIAEFKMNYASNSVISKEDVNLLEKLANSKNLLQILNNVIVENGIARASDLETEFYLTGIELPNGIYKPNKGALEITMEAIEDFPRKPIFVSDEQTIEFSINSDILEYYVDKLKYVVGKDDLKPVMKGICLHHTSNNKLFLAGTDANILLKVDITEYVEMPVFNKDMKFIIEPKMLYDFLNSVENTSLKIKSNLVATIIETDSWSFYARNIDGNYPNYNAVIPTNTNKLANVSIEPIKKAFNSELVKNYVKESDKNLDIFIFNQQDEVYIANSQRRRSDNPYDVSNIKKICETSVDFRLGEYYIENQSVLLIMPFGYDKQTNFSFRKDIVDRVIKIVNDNKMELHYTEFNRPYVIPIHSFEFKTTTKEHKIKEQKLGKKDLEEIAEIQNIVGVSEPIIQEKKYVIESKGFTQGVGSSANKIKRKKELDDLKNKIEIQEAIETLEMLLETANRKDKKEIKEAIEVLQMLLDTYEY